MTKTTKTTIVFLTLFVALMIVLSMRIPQHECEVCVAYNGETVCRTAAAGTREASVESAVTSACAVLASGMTESIRCQNTPPQRTTCRER